MYIEDNILLALVFPENIQRPIDNNYSKEIEESCKFKLDIEKPHDFSHCEYCSNNWYDWEISLKREGEIVTAITKHFEIQWTTEKLYERIDDY